MQSLTGKLPWILAIIIGLTVLGSAGAGAFTAFSQNTAVGSATDSFTAEENDSTPEELVLSRTNLIADSETVSVNTVTIASSTYDINYVAGTVTIDAAESDTDDSITVSYEYQRNLPALLFLIPVLAVVGLGYMFLKKRF